MKSFSIREQKQNELQWWGEQRISALNQGDDTYRLHCEKMINRLTKEIKGDVVEYVDDSQWDYYSGLPNPSWYEEKE